MAQYQSFPDAAGDSRTLEKLQALLLPDLAGRSFLDVGCNEGFFCGFARFAGASRSVGLDHSALFIERARRRFPDCEFFQQGWESLPEGQFDVILLASALHYAEDQAALVHRLVERLSPDGVLVLELGVVSSSTSEWVRVQRGIDEREFPTMAKLREVLQDFAWKWMGRSVSQEGDPVARHVVHVSRRRPVAYLLLQPPGFGKTSIATRLFTPAGVPVVSGDQQLALVARGHRQAGKRLSDIVKATYSPFQIDQVVQQVFAAGLGDELVELWIAAGGEGDFAIDAYVPTEHQEMVRAHLAQAGFLPILLEWERVGPRLLPAETMGQQAEAFFLSMAAPGSPRPARMRTEPPGHTIGFVDQVSLVEGRLRVRGWAVDRDGGLPSTIGVRHNGRIVYTDAFNKQSRPDVQRHLQLSHALLGYRAELELPGLDVVDDLAGSDFAVLAADGSVLRLAKAVAKLLEPKKA